MHLRGQVLILTSLLVVGHVSWAALAPALPAAQPKPLPKQTLSPYAKQVLSLHPVGYWRLGELKGPTAFDLSKQKHHGTYHGPIAFGQIGAIKNDPDRAVGLDGKSFVQGSRPAAISASV